MAYYMSFFEVYSLRDKICRSFYDFFVKVTNINSYYSQGRYDKTNEESVEYCKNNRW